MNAPIDLNLVRAFEAVAESGSFSAAAERLGVPRSTASRAIARLESELDVRLFQRTTRQVVITTAGRALLERVASPLASLDAALRDVPEHEAALSGTLRISTTADLAATVLAEPIERYTRAHPGMLVDVHVSTGYVDLVRDGYDLALRIHGASMRDSTMVAKPVGAITLALYASRGYLDARGVPRRSQDLATHDAVGFRGAKSFMALGPRAKELALPTPRVTADDMLVLRSLLRNGCGIGAIPTFLGDPDVASGTLVRVLPTRVAQTARVSLVHPSRAHVPKKVSTFRDLVIEHVRGTSLHRPTPR